MSIVESNQFTNSDWIPATEKAAADAALRTLRPLVPLVIGALEKAWGEHWQDELSNRLRPPFPTKLQDIRFLLKVLGSDRRLEPNPVRELFPDLVPELADSLRALVNKAQHEDDGWQPRDADRVERIANAILTCALPVPKMAFASVPGHHQEIFLIGSGGSLHHRWLPDEPGKSGWSAWDVMDADPTSAVAAVGSGADRLDLFILARDGRVEQRTWSVGNGWGSWKSLSQGGQAVTGPLRAVSLEPSHLEIFATGEHGDTVHRWAWSDEWNPWQVFTVPD